MKKMIIPSIVFLGILVLAVSASGDEAQLTNYYNDCISQKIDDCRRTANIFDGVCNNSCMRKLMEMRASQAKFYNNNKSELVNRMLLHDIGKKLYKIDYFLISQFKEKNQSSQSYTQK